MAQLKAGTRLRSSVCSTEFMVIAAPEGDLDVNCGGAPVIAIDAEPTGQGPAADATDGTAMGKRYVDESGALELLCTKPGDGSLALGGSLLIVKGAKPLPSSD